ncbi:hypothetical protein GORHZ_207_00060 [Gordonia rhizosphera NBRC 16068]|uniref:Uncharacterized protein n=1 Tax=Gordonia rhizosphera NBRC 16068 TaxID=1108045 RepID=K6WLX4_9ACTN|nr:hypothetical protein GORHZ_207_00060 [Gordonia rhizosphera NBRC 16068]
MTSEIRDPDAVMSALKSERRKSAALGKRLRKAENEIERLKGVMFASSDVLVTAAERGENNGE